MNDDLCGELKRGTVIVDLAAEKGGNTSFTQVDKVHYDDFTGVRVIGYTTNSYC